MSGDYICPYCKGYFCPGTCYRRDMERLIEIFKESDVMRSKGDGKLTKFEAEDLFVSDPYETKLEEDLVKNDPVNNPSHYTMGGIEVLDAVEAWGLDQDAYLFNAIKYIARAGKKDPTKYLQDLEKAQFYLNRKIANLKKDSR